MSDMVAKMDDFGRPAWIAAMVAGFVVFWPVGLGILAFLIWSGRMGCSRHDEYRQQRWERKMSKWQDKMSAWSEAPQRGFRPSGNAAFDEYRTETLRRLEDEAKDFTSFLDRLRMAKDKAEFEQFMADRRAAAQRKSDDDHERAATRVMLRFVSHHGLQTYRKARIFACLSCFSSTVHHPQLLDFAFPDASLMLKNSAQLDACL